MGHFVTVNLTMQGSAGARLVQSRVETHWSKALSHANSSADTDFIMYSIVHEIVHLDWKLPV